MMVISYSINYNMLSLVILIIKIVLHINKTETFPRSCFVVLVY